MDLADADGGGLGAGLQHPRPGHAGHVGTQIVVIQHRREFRNQRSGALRLKAHGQLVAKMRWWSSRPMPGNAHMLAEMRNRLHIEFVQRHQALKLAASRQIRNRIGYLFKRQPFRHVNDFIQDFVRPIGLAMLVRE